MLELEKNPSFSSFILQSADCLKTKSKLEKMKEENDV